MLAVPEADARRVNAAKFGEDAAKVRLCHRVPPAVTVVHEAVGARLFPGRQQTAGCRLDRGVNFEPSFPDLDNSFTQGFQSQSVLLTVQPVSFGRSFRGV